MNTIQTNVRVQPDDKPLIRAIAARLRIEPRFRERLRGLIEDDPTPALAERVEKLEEQVEWLLAGGDTPTRPSLRNGTVTVTPHLPSTNGHAS